jgi:hypothetical protein
VSWEGVAVDLGSKAGHRFKTAFKAQRPLIEENYIVLNDRNQSRFCRVGSFEAGDIS